MRNIELEAEKAAALRELHRSQARIVAAADTERKRLEQNLHDGVQQRLVALCVKLRRARDGSVTTDQLGELVEDLDAAIAELRDVAHGIYPQALTDLGVVAALHQVRRRTPIPIELVGPARSRWPTELESAVYFCCVEAIQNAVKHGGPTVHVSVAIRQSSAHLRFEVSDDGHGFNPAGTGRGAGLQNIRDRVGALDGQVSIVSRVGRGTMVYGSIPLPCDDARSVA